MKKEYLLAGVSILFWGSSASVTRLMMSSLSSIDMLFYGGITAVGFLICLNFFTGRLEKLRSIRPAQLVQMCLLGLLGMSLASVSLYLGMTRLKTQQAYIINYLWPILVVVFSWPILGERMTPRKSIALLLSFFGVAIVASEGNLTNLTQVDLVGVLACVVAAASYALFSVLNVKVTCDKFVAMMVYYASSTAAALLILLFDGRPFPILGLPQLGGMLWMGVLTSGLAYTTWAIAMDIGDTAKLSNLAYITPFVSLIFIYILLKEPILWSSYVGLIFIVLGVVVQIVGVDTKRERV